MSRFPGSLDEGRARRVALIAVTGIAEAALAGVAAFATRDVFAALHTSAGMPIRALAILGVSALFLAGLRVLSRTFAEALGQSYARALRANLYTHFAGMSREILQSRRQGALALRFVGDLTAVRGWVGLGIARLVAAIFVLPGAFLTLFLLSPSLAVAATPVIVTFLILMALFAPRLQGLQERLRRARGSIAISMSERVAMASELDLSGRTSRELRMLDERGADLQNIAVRHRVWISALRALPEIGVGLAGVAVLMRAVQAGVPAAEAAGALALLGILIMPLRDLATLWDRYCAWKVARAKCEAIFAQPSRLRRPRRSGNAPRITLKEVQVAGDQITRDIPAGEILWVSGSSAPDFLAVVAGINSASRGKIRFDGNTRRPSTVYVGPTPTILQGSLRRALTLGMMKRPADQELKDVAEAYGVSHLINAGRGLDGRVAEAGRSLSPEDAFRLQVARAALVKPRVLVIDAALAVVTSDLLKCCMHLQSETGATALISIPRVPAGLLGEILALGTQHPADIQAGTSS